MVGTFFVLGYSDLPIMIYSHLEGGCECVQRRCHESRIPGRHNIYDIPLYVIMCHHNMFSCNLFLFKIKEFPRNAWNMTKHLHHGKYISSKLFIFLNVFHWQFLCLGGRLCWHWWSQSWWVSSSSSVWENESWRWGWTVKWAKWARRSSEKPKIWNKIIPW